MTEVEFNKKILIGHTKPSIWGERNRVFLEATIKRENNEQKRSIDLKPIKNYKTLSISGHSKHFAGQIYDELNEKNIDFLPNRNVKEIVSVWKKWHLNYLQAGTLRQQKALGHSKRYDYDKAVNKLKKKKIYNDRGYTYGSAWLVNPLPSRIEKKVKKLF